MKDEPEKESGLKIIAVPAAIILLLLLGWGGYSLFTSWLSNKTSQVQAIILSAELDNQVQVPNSNQTVEKIVSEMEITFPFGQAPDSIADLSVRDQSEAPVDVDWGRFPPEAVEVQGRSATKWLIRQVFFPPDFREGKLWDKTHYLCYIKMIAVKPAAH